MIYIMEMSYEHEMDVPDFGTIQLIYSDERVFGMIETPIKTPIKRRVYTLLARDVSKLSLINNAADGSTAIVGDTSEIYMLCDGMWRKWVGSSSGGLESIIWGGF